MIVKRLYCKVKSEMWDSSKMHFNFVITTYYIGWFLFGKIPIYLTEIDKIVNNKLEEEVKEYRHVDYRTYGHLLRKENKNEN